MTLYKQLTDKLIKELFTLNNRPVIGTIDFIINSLLDSFIKEEVAELLELNDSQVYREILSFIFDKKDLEDLNSTLFNNLIGKWVVIFDYKSLNEYLELLYYNDVKYNNSKSYYAITTKRVNKHFLNRVYRVYEIDLGFRRIPTGLIFRVVEVEDSNGVSYELDTFPPFDVIDLLGVRFRRFLQSIDDSEPAQNLSQQIINSYSVHEYMAGYNLKTIDSSYLINKTNQVYNDISEGRHDYPFGLN